jgi:hypothetical protein
MLEGTALIPPDYIEFELIDSLPNTDFTIVEAQQFIAGKITDENGAAVGDVELEIRRQDQSGEIDALVDENGNFIIPIKPGIWEIELKVWEFPEYMIPGEIKVEVLETDDTLTIAYPVHTTDDIIAGTIEDPDEVIQDMEEEIWIYGGTVGEEHDWRIHGELDPDGSFSFAVSSDIEQYEVEAEINAELPDGYYLMPQWHENVAPGTDDLVFTLSQSSKFIKALVLTDHGDTVKTTGGYITNADNSYYDLYNATAFETDENGEFLERVVPGEYVLLLFDPNVVNPIEIVEVTEDVADTVEITYTVLATDSSISGSIVGETDELEMEDDFRILATTSAGDGEEEQEYVILGTINTEGNFEVQVASQLESFHVTLIPTDWQMSREYLISPWAHEGVEPGVDTLEFEIRKIEGMIFGEIQFEVPDSADVFVMARDPESGLEIWRQLYEENTFEIPVPNGSYEVMAGYCKNNSCRRDTIAGVVIENDEVYIIFGEDSAQIVGATQTLAAAPVVFMMKNYPNPFHTTTTLNFATPVRGAALLRIYDLSGKLVATLFDGKVEPGYYTAGFSLNSHNASLSSAAYIARLTIEGEQRLIKTVRMISTR